jgi:hypothetical protein
MTMPVSVPMGCLVIGSKNISAPRVRKNPFADPSGDSKTVATFSDYTRRFHRALQVICFLILLCTVPCAASAAEQNISAYIIDAGTRWNVPARLILAIAKQESQFQPWAVNVAGKPYFPASKADALALIHAAHIAGRPYDMGLMQINSAWLKKLHLDPAQVIEPRNNILVGAWILALEIRRYGLGWKAVASYHTPVDRHPERGRKYALAIINHLEKLP